MKRQILVFAILFAYITIVYSQPDTVWTKTLDGATTDVAFSVQETSDLGFILCGYSRSVIDGTADVWLVKTMSNGDTSWTRKFGTTGDDIGYRVRQTFGGGYIISGFSEQGTDDFWLIHTDANGDTIWTKTYGHGGYDYVGGISMV